MVAAAASRVLVVGSGAIGLRTAVELVRKNVQVVLRSPKHPLDPSVCSQGAGGLWMPFHCDDPRTDRWAMETLDELLPLAKDTTGNDLVELIPSVVLKRENDGPTPLDMVSGNYSRGTGGKSRLPQWSTDARLDFQHLSVEMLCWQNLAFKLRIPPQKELVEAGYKHAWFFRPPIVDCPKMLETMLQEVRESNAHVDVDVETNLEYESIEHMVEDAKSLDCDAVVNCTGLGAAKLCQDDQLIVGRGVLLHYDRESCVRRSSMEEGVLHDTNILTEDIWGSEENPCYMIVRGKTIVVGGTYLEGDTEPNLRDEERRRLLQNAELLGIDTSLSKPIGEWAGFRPYRPTSRCELDPTYAGDNGDIRLVHSYGYGGSGWTIYVGCAKEATQLLLDQ